MSDVTGHFRALDRVVCSRLSQATRRVLRSMQLVPGTAPLGGPISFPARFASEALPAARISAFGPSWFQYPLLTATVHDLHIRIRAPRQDLDVSFFATEHESRAILGRCELHVRASFRIDEAQLHRLGRALRAVRHLHVWIGWKDLDLGADPTLFVDELERTPAQDPWRSLLVGRERPNASDHQQDESEIQRSEHERESSPTHESLLRDGVSLQLISLDGACKGDAYRPY